MSKSKGAVGEGHRRKRNGKEHRQVSMEIILPARNHVDWLEDGPAGGHEN